MCYYNGVKVPHAEYIRLKQLEKSIANLDFLNRPLQSGFEYDLYPVLKRREGELDFDIVQMEWGFIPHYAKNRDEVNFFRRGGTDPKTGKFKPPILTLNAIGEDILEKTTYKQAVKERRCLVLSSGFYEWRHVYPKNKRNGQPLKTAVKYPYFITMKDKEYFFMAGIWTPWTDLQTGEIVESFAIVTTKANGLMKQIHNSKERMPVILNDDLAYEWLFEDLSNERIAELAITQANTNEMAAHPVAKDFQTALDPQELFTYEELPVLEEGF